MFILLLAQLQFNLSQTFLQSVNPHRLIVNLFFKQVLYRVLADQSIFHHQVGLFKIVFLFSQPLVNFN